MAFDKKEYHRQYNAKWRVAHPDRVRAASLKWSREHPEEARERTRKYYRRNRLNVLAKARQWRKENPELALQQRIERRQKDPTYTRRRHLKYNYGLTLERFNQMLVAQDGKCRICHGDLIKPFVDHEHKTGYVRGILCPSCNNVLGLAKDRPDILQAAINYLKEMNATLIEDIKQLSWDGLTMAQASEVMGALREAVQKGEAWFNKFSAGFVNGKSSGVHQSDVQTGPSSKVSAKSGQVSAKLARSVPMSVPPKRGRGRPRKVVPEIVSPTRQVRGGGSSDRDNSPPGASPADEHPPIGVLAGSYVSTTGPDPNRAYSLPVNHPRAAGAALPASADADFAAVEAGKVRFQ